MEIDTTKAMSLGSIAAIVCTDTLMIANLMLDEFPNPAFGTMLFVAVFNVMAIRAVPSLIRKS
ncbi:hypothetical protein HOI83_01065, partial [Candidatus Uhrbacteria bacterium]|nr:hypothetical protein [Candidatus Uhrbacteria bacterium]